jgi:hypothetical protein
VVFTNWFGRPSVSNAGTADFIQRGDIMTTEQEKEDLREKKRLKLQERQEHIWAEKGDTAARIEEHKKDILLKEKRIKSAEHALQKLDDELREISEWLQILNE